MGGVVGDLNARRGKITGMNPRQGVQIIDAEVPLNQMFGYATAVRSLSQGRASYSMLFDHYERVPNAIAEGIIQRLGGG
jgi:elongation factor G